jgi:hypothetical protein
MRRDLRQHIHIIRAALDHLESTETVFANQWIHTAKEQARRLEEEALHLVENAQLDIESMPLQVAAFSIDDTLRRIDRDWRVFTASKGWRSRCDRALPWLSAIGVCSQSSSTTWLQTR